MSRCQQLFALLKLLKFAIVDATEEERKVAVLKDWAILVYF